MARASTRPDDAERDHPTADGARAKIGAKQDKHAGRLTPLRRQQLSLVAADFVAVGCATLLALLARSGGDANSAAGLALTALMPAAVIASFLATSAYDERCLGGGFEEFRRVGRGFEYLAGIVVVVSYLANTSIGRGLLIVAWPLGLALAVLGRYLMRRRLLSQRRKGHALKSTLLVGDAHSIAEFMRQIRNPADAGIRIIGACIPDQDEASMTEIFVMHELGIETLGDVNMIHDVVDQTGVDIVAVVSASFVGSQKLRWISWQLESRPTNLVVVPGLVDVAGSRLQIHPVAGLPLLHVEAATLTGPGKFAKALFDRTASLLGLLILSPFLLGIAAAIRLDSPGPALFRQKRVGMNGDTFTMVKFRSMSVSAEVDRISLESENQHGDEHVLFKMKDDPRITRVGAWLRKLSLDELPQLLNVVSGSMSLVGPRPPLPSEVERYDTHVHRRFLVKPGLTGLWQVSGRSDLDWDDTVRLDLRYVENWSITGDLHILWKTVFAVLKRDGAY